MIPDHEQAKLFFVSDEGQIVPSANAYNEESHEYPAVDLADRARLLINVISLLQQADSLDRVRGLAPIVHNAENKAGRIRFDAQALFYTATGSKELEETSLTTVRRLAGVSSAQLFTSFLREYFFPGHLGNPDEFKQTLMQQLIDNQTIYNRKNNLRPHKPDKEIKDTLEQLDTPGKASGATR